MACPHPVHAGLVWLVDYLTSREGRHAMVNAINPADVQPGEVWSVDPPEGRDGEWIGVRHAPSERESWRLCRTVNTGLFYASDSAVVLRHRLVPAPHDGRWTREDLPSVSEIIGTYTHWNTDPGPVTGHALDAVVEHLNANGGAPADPAEQLMREVNNPDPEKVALDEARIKANIERNEARRETDRWRRAHEIVERERDQAREERDEAQVRYRDTATALTEWHRRWVEMERERDQARESLHEACKVAQSYKVDAYQATERAEAAEARTAPTVTRDDIEKAIRGKVWAANRDPNKAGFHRVHIAWATDSVWSLVSGADPAVHVVRESDVAAVEVRRASDGWYADGAWLASADETAEWVRDRATEMVVCAARNEAVARAIEQAADPVLDKAQEFAALADWELTDREAELLHAVAAHVLGQEEGDE